MPRLRQWGSMNWGSPSGSRISNRRAYLARTRELGILRPAILAGIADLCKLEFRPRFSRLAIFKERGRHDTTGITKMPGNMEKINRGIDAAGDWDHELGGVLDWRIWIQEETSWANVVELGEFVKTETQTSRIGDKACIVLGRIVDRHLLKR